MKRLLLFVLLLGAGFYALYEFVGEDFIVTAGGNKQDDKGSGAGDSRDPTAAGDPADKQQPGRNDPSGLSIGINDGSFGATAEQRGSLTYPRTRDVREPDGSIRKEPVFVLRARDSQPVQSGMQELFGVETTIYDKGNKAAVVRADNALVELGLDENGKRTFQANKEIALTNVRFEALPGSSLEGLALDLDTARVLVDDHELHLYTPTPDVPVRLTFAGERAVTLDGKGLQARLPRDPDGALQRIDINILSEPVLRTKGIVARANGLLHYAENSARQIAELSLTDEVVVELEGGGRLGNLGGGSSGIEHGNTEKKTRIHADQMLAWLRRGSEIDFETGKSRDGMAWRMLELRGAPARVELPDVHVSTPQLTVLPGLFGLPFWITASGGISNIEQVDGLTLPDGTRREPFRGTSPRRIHLLRGREHLAATHRAFGFPQWAVAPLDQFHGVLFEGESHLEDGQRVVDTADGLHVFQTDERQEGVIARGFGAVEMAQRPPANERGGKVDEAIHATGSDGFQLIKNGSREDVQLGPIADPNDPRWPAHRYEVRRGELVATGNGACRIEHERDAAGELTIVTLHSPGKEVHATLSSRDAVLEDVRWLRAEFEGNEVRAFDLAGLPARATFERDGERYLATAPRITQTSTNTLRLLPPIAGSELWDGLDATTELPVLHRKAAATDTRGEQILDAKAPRIDLHYVGQQRVIVDARRIGDIPATATARVARRAGEPPIRIELEADRLRALPSLLTPPVMQWHVGGRRDPVAMLPFQSESGAWILGDGVRRLQATEANGNTFEGHAAQMCLAVAAQACLLLGDPRTLTPAVATRHVPGRSITARGAQVRLFRDEAARLQAFRAFPGHSARLLPEVEMHQEGSSDLLSHVLATCRGDIDVLPGTVNFDGSVVVQTIAADGSTSNAGPGIVADSLAMELDPDTGEVKRVVGSGVDLDWDRVSGRAAEVELETRWNRVTARDPEGMTFTLENGTTVFGQRVTVDYETLGYSFYKGRVVR
ncbi:MAG: hypothetical protein NXI31_05635 [bacterium]|nr:hypothetical protein [bacterium]